MKLGAIIYKFFRFAPVFSICEKLLLMYMRGKDYPRAASPRLFWGIVPIINMKHWNNAMKSRYTSHSVVKEIYEIHNADDFDELLDDVIVRSQFLPSTFKWIFQDVVFMDYLLKNYDIIHSTFDFVLVQKSRFEEKVKLLQDKQMKIVLSPYGGDIFVSSSIGYLCGRHNYIRNWPAHVRDEEKIRNNLKFWEKRADAIITGLITEGVGRWDMLPVTPIVIDTDAWSRTTQHFNDSTGKDKPISITHSPSRRYGKGTHFVIKAVEALRQEGYKINFILIENLTNNQVLEKMKSQSDLHIEDLNFGFSLNAIEAMSLGLPVISNIEWSTELVLYRRYSYLDENPIVSATPEDIKETLRHLIENPELRRTLGELARKYALKYHSYNMAREMFSALYDKIYFNKNREIINFFDPANPEAYNHTQPEIVPPLKNNKLNANEIHSPHRL